jgi:hypothetical protein
MFSVRNPSLTTFVGSTLVTLVASALAVACGGAPDAGSQSTPQDSIQADRSFAPSACHGAANADSVVGISCDKFSPFATSYALEVFQGGSWVAVAGSHAKTPDLTDEGTSGAPTDNGPPADPTYPRSYHIRAEVPEGFVYSDPIEVTAPQ